MYSLGDKIFEVTSELIHKAFNFPTIKNPKSFSDESLILTYKHISKENKEGLFKLILPPNSQFPPPTMNYQTTLFSEDTQHVLVQIWSLLGEYDTRIVSEQALGF